MVVIVIIVVVVVAVAFLFAIEIVFLVWQWGLRGHPIPHACLPVGRGGKPEGDGCSAAADHCCPLRCCRCGI